MTGLKILNQAKKINSNKKNMIHPTSSENVDLNNNLFQTIKILFFQY